MDLLKWLIGGAVGGAVGAAIWAAIAYSTGYEIGWIAWIVGGLVGLGVRVGAQDNTSAFAGMVAAVIAVASVFGGRYAAISMYAQDAFSEIVGELEVDDETAVAFIARDIVQTRERSGSPVALPGGIAVEEAFEESDFPRGIWDEAMARWNNTTAAYKADYKRDLLPYIQAQVRGYQGQATQEAFMESFDAMDIIFFVFAVITAFGVASGVGTD